MNGLETLPAWFWIVISIVSIWSAIWKGFALWKAARKSHLAWFIILIIFNTAGILEILYIYVFSNCCKRKQPQAIKPQGKKK